MLSKKEQQLLDALVPRARQEGVEIVTLVVAGAKKAPTIRVYIDTEDGVSFDELSAAQAWINDLMDEIDPFPGCLLYTSPAGVLRQPGQGAGPALRDALGLARRNPRRLRGAYGVAGRASPPAPGRDGVRLSLIHISRILLRRRCRRARVP